MNVKHTGQTGLGLKPVCLVERYDIEDWSRKFGVSAERVTEALVAVGDRAEDIEAWLYPPVCNP